MSGKKIMDAYKDLPTWDGKIPICPACAEVLDEITRGTLICPNCSKFYVTKEALE